MGGRIGRRGLLIGAGLGAVGLAALGTVGYQLVERDVLPGRSELSRALGRCDAAAPTAPRAIPGPLVTGAFDSTLRGQQVSYALRYPPGHDVADRLPVCLALHGYGGSGSAAVDTGDYPALLAGYVRAGGAPFVLAGADGGQGYWHPHPGDDPLGMLFTEFLPILAAQGLLVEQVAVAGWSMGGYGALLCALTQPGRVACTVASSPAVFHSYADAHRVNPGSFDSAQQWRDYDVTRRAAEFAGQPLRIDIGSGDPFTPAVRTLAGDLKPGTVHIATGCHDNDFWTYAAQTQIPALGAALASANQT